MSKIESATTWAINVANDDSHGYDQINRWGQDYDCSSLVISAYQQAGVPVKDNGATYTGNMYDVFTNTGFEDVTGYVDMSNGDGMQRGDVLLNNRDHTALFIGDGQLVQASINEFGGVAGGQVGDQTGVEIATRGYYNYPWDCVLRYVNDDNEDREDERTMYEKIVRADYVRELGRDVDSAGLETFTNMLMGGASEQEVINCLVNSPEWAHKFVGDCYKAFLGREASDDEIDGWLGDGSTSLRDICDAIYNSEEAQNRRGE